MFGLLDDIKTLASNYQNVVCDCPQNNIKENHMCVVVWHILIVKKKQKQPKNELRNWLTHSYFCC